MLSSQRGPIGGPRPRCDEDERLRKGDRKAADRKCWLLHESCAGEAASLGENRGHIATEREMQRRCLAHSDSQKGDGGARVKRKKIKYPGSDGDNLA